LQELKQFEKALTSYERALAMRPNYAQAHWNEGLLRLLIGDFIRGWAKFEWRWETKDFAGKRPNINAPAWRGEDLAGRHLLIFSEQGLGDIVQFIRYLPLLIERKAKITFLTHDKLLRLLRPLDAQIRMVSSLQGNEVFDFQCALMSLPHWCKTDLSSIPDKVPYLMAEEELSRRWKKRIGEHGFKIGIAWQGNPQTKIDQGRSIPLEHFIPLTRLPGVRLISLQKHHGLEQLERLPADVKIESLGDDFDSGPDAFIDTAAVMHNLDLIITSDTSIAHLAGALGHPTWVALKYLPDYRWMLDRSDSPWYPTMRLFRQQDRDQWEPVFRQIEEQLQALIGRRSSSNAPAPSQPSVEVCPRIVVSWGELLDRITILEIKLQRIKSEAAVANVRHELEGLSAAADEIEARYPHLAIFKKELRSVNETLWNIEDAIREKERSKSFDHKFIDLARSVYIKNDHRAHLKREISRLVNSELVEEKQYAPYN
jgi:tetratricopeptide (TPR) repeat protein